MSARPRAGTNYFNPHSPCGERRAWQPSGACPQIFQSTLPMRGATAEPVRSPGRWRISIHTPHAGSDAPKTSIFWGTTYFNPHSPCGERPPSPPAAVKMFPFQSTLPMRGATCLRHIGDMLAVISIHTPHAGSDACGPTRSAAGTDFNPHSPCGERPRRYRHPASVQKFQSTLPMRGATQMWACASASRAFQSTLPMRGATTDVGVRIGVEGISIHTPHAGSDHHHTDCARRVHISIHTPHAGSDSPRSPTNRSRFRFQSTLPMRGATRVMIAQTVNAVDFNPHSPCGERPV